jgi:WD40 repeat protein
MILKGHREAISKLFFTPDGKQLLSLSDDGTVRQWDAVTGKELQKRDGFKSVTSISFRADGKQMAWGKNELLLLTGW